MECFIQWIFSTIFNIVHYGRIWLGISVLYSFFAYATRNILEKINNYKFRIAIFAILSFLIYSIIIINYTWSSIFESKFQYVYKWQMYIVVPIIIILVANEIFPIILGLFMDIKYYKIILKYIIMITVLIPVFKITYTMGWIILENSKITHKCEKEFDRYLKNKYGISDARLDYISVFLDDSYAIYFIGNDKGLGFRVSKDKDGHITDYYDAEVFSDRKQFLKILDEQRPDHILNSYFEYEPKGTSRHEDVWNADLSVSVFINDHFDIDIQLKRIMNYLNAIKQLIQLKNIILVI